jgi:plasmid maintenance system antidote protein VapI
MTSRNPLARYLKKHNLSYAAFGRLTGAHRSQIHRCATDERGPGRDLALRIEKVTEGDVPVSSWSRRSRRVTPPTVVAV